MPGPCSFCKALTTRNNPEIKCGRCQSLFHLKCVNLPLTLADLSNDDFSWICKPCRGALNDPPSYVGELLNSIRALQDDMSDIKTKQSDFLESLSFYGGKIDDFSVQLNSFKTVFETVNSLKQELSEVKAECQLLRQEVENLNQYTRINNVEICGVPEVKNENLVAIVKKIGEVCNVGLADGDIDACHRVFRYPATSSSQPTAPKNIIVKFVNRTRKHDLLAAALNENSSDDTSSSDSSTDVAQSSSTDSSDEEFLFKQKRHLHRVKEFTEVSVQKYDDMEFKEHFRLTRYTYNYLKERIKNSKILPSHKYGRKKIEIDKALQMTLWYLSNNETYRQISDRFNVTKSSAYRTIRKILKYFVSISKAYIKWPSESKKVIIQNHFQNNGFDEAIGAIDGSHINIKRPSHEPQFYCNRKSQYSILIQAVCDHEKRFLDFFAGEVGSLHDARLLKRSSLYAKAINGFLGNNYLLGDSAYPVLEWLIPPYKDNGHLSQNQKLFNYKHSSSRCVIENAFALLKGRFRRLRFFDNDNIPLVIECTVAAAVLHNICIDLNDEVIVESEEDTFVMPYTTDLNQSYDKRHEIFCNMFNIEM
ncbi:hypothetical protein MML48_3g00015506 [Holotrichia oblita]|uniref:Uncharacterized protein n=1 Tax=Holotrichia oblita TaxID=644536 RepID=A0ACB9TBJ9_HOLOL|nr:hypothetical protein MML48_3g00015506 [Holotrichia oblita]